MKTIIFILHAIESKKFEFYSSGFILAQKFTELSKNFFKYNI